MLKPLRGPAAIVWAAIFACLPAWAAEGCTGEAMARTYPGKDWVRADPATTGWSPTGLDAAWDRGRRSFSAGMLVHRGRMIGAFGDIAQPMETRSMRKAFLNVVIGQLVARKKLRLDATLAQMGIDEVTPLTDIEKSATLRDLLTSRSGVYLPAAYVVPGDAEGVPARGTHRPGEAFYYWNWGFNALGTIVEQAAGKSVFPLIAERVARPLGLQDFDPARDTRYVREPVSRHPAYLLDMSTRDRARIGLLFVNNGCWRGRQIVSRQWVQDSIAPVTDQAGDFDYGYLWWSTEAPKHSGLTQRIFMARGFANQYIIGIPELDAVFVLSVDMAGGRAAGLKPPRRSDYEAVLDLVLKASPGRREAE